MASRSLSDLTPKTRELCLKWIDACKAQGLDVLVYCTYRSKEEQDELYKIGRTVKGEHASPDKPMGDVVTNARGGQSFHNYRCAFDFVPLLGGKPQWGNQELYAKAGGIAESLGLQWAGRWKGSLRETAHCQYSSNLSISDLQHGAKVE